MTLPVSGFTLFFSPERSDKIDCSPSRGLSCKSSDLRPKSPRQSIDDHSLMLFFESRFPDRFRAYKLRFLYRPNPMDLIASLPK